jgi:hypothetical protein
MINYCAIYVFYHPMWQKNAYASGDHVTDRLLFTT